ncbi:Phage portal protein, lambda family [Aliarcobacter thereius]|uniref:Phage portal protein, lambda family n=1 Tax=Aliarcobacter thereius TaxID=544718 RepID=A0A1C0B7E1_9BACT|nr:phage portal protein [Aliarcobacter thereius]OCL99525.1 Phage portal protein, lambda family [Aliarcobacter thereius]
MNKIVRTVLWASNVATFGTVRKFYERAFYEGAKQTRLNRDFNIQNNHFELQASSDRDMLRARARWLSSNNPICKSIDNSIIKNVIGSGISLQSRIDKNEVKNAEELNNKIETLWNEFIKKQNFDVTGRASFRKFQKMLLKAKLVDGESLINCVWTKDKQFPLKFQIVEVDQFDISKKKNKDNTIFSGVEIDSFGKPVAYHLKTEINSFTSKRFESKNIIHFYDSERATQYRGISDYAQTINNIKDFQAYNDSEIIKNRILASFATFIKTTSVGGSLFGDTKTGEKQGSSDPIKEVTAGMIRYLRPGEEVQSIQSNQLGNSYNDFIKNTIRIIAAGRDISYELAIRDYSQVNFSSARASLIQDNKRFDDEQILLIEDALNPIFEMFIDSVVLSGALKLPNDYWTNKEKYISPIWIKPTREWVDPLKDIKAIEYEIKLGLNSKTRAAAGKGRDYEEILDEQINEEKMMIEKRKKAGLEVAPKNEE